MLLAEAIIEKHHIHKLIDKTVDSIERLMFVSDVAIVSKNAKITSKLTEELDTLINKYHEWCLLIDKSESSIAIKLVDGVSLSLSSARCTRDVFELKLNSYSTIMEEAESYQERLCCVDVEELHTIVNSLEENIKNLDVKIEHTTWSETVD